MNIVIDPTPLYILGSKHPFIITFYLIKMFGWLPIVVVIIWGLWKLWMNFIQDEFCASIKYVLLAIDVPKDNLQTPKAVEQIFVQLAGAHSGPNLVEKYWEGYIQPGFTLEVISINGYIQFLIHTPEMFRDLVEASIYAQYPNAEITEVEDYVNNVPKHYPNDEYTLWGTELILVKPECYPLKTYIEFETPIGEEAKEIDPMAALLEIMSKFNQGEQGWFQIIIIPIEQDWKLKCDAEVKKLIKEAVPEKKKTTNKVLDSFLGNLNAMATSVGELIMPGGVAAKKEEKKQEYYNIVQYLTEGDKTIIGSIQRKAAKIGYKCKMRLLYVARHEVFKKQRGVSGMFGAIKQFNTNDRNAIKPETKRVATKINYFFKTTRENIRRNKIIQAYNKRSLMDGTKNISVLNTEELATLWHFPMAHVKAPLIKKTEVKKVEPPFNLPMAEHYLKSKEDAPMNLPYEQ